MVGFCNGFWESGRNYWVWGRIILRVIVIHQLLYCYVGPQRLHRLPKFPAGMYAPPLLMSSANRYSTKPGRELWRVSSSADRTVIHARSKPSPPPALRPLYLLPTNQTLNEY